MCAPSKYYSYLQGGLPIIAVTEANSYLAREAQKERVGKTVLVGDGNSLAAEILALYASPIEVQEMSVRAENLYRAKYQMSIALDEYLILLRKILGEKHE